MSKSSHKFKKELNVLMLNNGFRLARETKRILWLVLHILQIYLDRKGGSPSLVGYLDVLIWLQIDCRRVNDKNKRVMQSSAQEPW